MGNGYRGNTIMNYSVKETKANKLPFTGERFTPETKGKIELEHLHRYLFTNAFTQNRVILDIACGEGYGSYIMAHNASYVIGVDNSEGTISHARAKYTLNNLAFMVGSCLKIPVNDGKIDVVVSFETIEHHNQHEEMLKEIKRVLKPGGLLIISSPDKYEHSDKTVYTNPWHVKELYRKEFEDLLGNFFKYKTLLGQKVIYGSILASDFSKYKIETFDINHPEKSAEAGTARPLFFIGIASDEVLPEINHSILEQPLEDSDIQKQITAFAERADNAETYAKSLLEALGKSRQATTEALEYIRALTIELEKLKSHWFFRYFIKSIR
jgi:ubiquinone/menaquinone biosynthesis C-methylase UbiE